MLPAHYAGCARGAGEIVSESDNQVKDGQTTDIDKR
jgi:hypothetical protein